jgi:copper(I)-binding protein
MMLRVIALLVAGTLALPVLAREFRAGPIVISQAWSRPTAEGMSMGVAYLTLVHRGRAADVLVGASSPLAESVEFHETSVVDGMSRMRPRTDIPITPGATVKLEPAGLHLMLVGLRQPLVAGGTLPLTLQFRDAGRVTIEVSVGDPAAL